MKSRFRNLCLLTAVASLFAGCARTPPQREARFMETARRLAARKEYRRAALMLRNAIQAMPRDAEPYYQLGLCYLAADNQAAAIECFRKATELNPKHAAAQLKLAGLLSAGGDKAALADAQRRARSVAAAFPDNVDALNALALTELRLGDPQDAVVHLQQALDLLPGGLTSSALLMRARLAQGDAKGAEQAIQQCFRKSPQSAEVALVMGRFYLVTHHTQEAEQQFQRAIRINPQYGPALLDLGMTLFHAGRRDEAGPIFKRLAALPDKTYQPVYAIFLVETGQSGAAITELEHLAALDRSDRAARTRLVKIYLASGRNADAEKLLDGVLARNPKDADALLQRGEFFIDAAKYQKALADLNLVLRYHPDAAEPHAVLAHLYAVLGKTLNQRQELAEALKLNPSLISVRLQLVRLLIASKGATAALEILDQAPDSQKRTLPYIVESNWALLDLGRRDEARKGIAQGLLLARTPDLLLQDALLKIGGRDFAGARASLDRLLRQSPEDVRALRALVQMYDARREHPAAIHTVREYVARHPNSASLQNYLGELLLADNQLAAARAAFTAAESADPHFRSAQLALARLDVSEGRFDSARRSVAAIFAASPNEPELWLYMGWLANCEKNYEEAITWFRKVVDAEPSDVIALNNLAYLLASQTSQIDEALQYAQQVKEIAPDNKGVDDTIGWIMYRKGLYSSAVKYLESAAQGQNDPVIRYHLGMAYLKIGDKRGAPTLRAVLQDAPGLAEARMAEHLLEGGL